MNLSIFKICKDLCELKSVLKSVRGDEKYYLEIPILVLMKKIFHIKMLSFQTQYKLKKELELGYLKHVGSHFVYYSCKFEMGDHVNIGLLDLTKALSRTSTFAKFM